MYIQEGRQLAMGEQGDVTEHGYEIMKFNGENGLPTDKDFIVDVGYETMKARGEECLTADMAMAEDEPDYENMDDADKMVRWWALSAIHVRKLLQHF